MGKSIDLNEDEQLEKRALELKTKDERLKNLLSNLSEEHDALSKEYEDLSEQKSKMKESKKTSKLKELKDRLENLQLAYDEKMQEKESRKTEEKKPKPPVDNKYEEELTRKYNAIADVKAELEFKLNEITKEVGQNCIMDEIERSLEEIKYLEEKINNYKSELKRIQSDIQEIKENIESEMEQKALLSADLLGLKSNDYDGQDGKSLFSEVEDKRQKHLSQLKIISNYYERLKSQLAAKQNELSRLNIEKTNLQSELSQDSIIKKINDKLQDACYSRIQEIDEFIRRKGAEFSGTIYGRNKFNIQWFQSFLQKYKDETHYYERLKLDLHFRYIALKGQVRILSVQIEKLEDDRIELMNQKLNMENEPKEPLSEVNGNLKNPSDRKTVVSFADGTKN